MANPQKENGSTDIANELLEAIYSYDFTATQFKILLCIIRYTYGFKRKFHKLSINFISKAINNNSKEFISREIKKLINDNVLIEYLTPSFNCTREIGINKDYSCWGSQQLSNKSTPYSEVNTTVDLQVNRPVDLQVNQETKNKTKKETKNIYGEFRRIKLTKNEYARLCDDFGKTMIDNQIKKLDEYVESNNNKNKYTNFNLVLRKSIRENWFKNQTAGTPEWIDKKVETEKVSKEDEDKLKKIINKYK